MGRFLACGIAMQFKVYRNSKVEGKDKKDLVDIKNRLNEFFSIDNYEVDDETYSDAFLFTIKKDYLEKNIHGVISELSNLYYIDIDHIFLDDNWHTNFAFSNNNKKIDYKSKDFCQKNYPLKLKYVDDYGKKCLRLEGEYGHLTEFEDYFESAWIYEKNSIFGWEEKYRLRVVTSAIWIDFNKYSGEDESNMLYTLNSMKNSYFKHPLSENLYYYIFG